MDTRASDAIDVRQCLFQNGVGIQVLPNLPCRLAAIPLPCSPIPNVSKDHALIIWNTALFDVIDLPMTAHMGTHTSLLETGGSREGNSSARGGRFSASMRPAKSARACAASRKRARSPYLMPGSKSQRRHTFLCSAPLPPQSWLSHKKKRSRGRPWARQRQMRFAERNGVHPRRFELSAFVTRGNSEL